MVGCATATLVAATILAGVASSRTSPELDPKSDKKFFKDDYPDDQRPLAEHHFSHPFPITQESHDYDKDYVKDENSDNGEWKAQDDYDRLRIAIVKLRENATKMAEWERRGRKDWLEAKGLAEDFQQSEEWQKVKEQVEEKEKDGMIVAHDTGNISRFGHGSAGENFIPGGAGGAGDLADCLRELELAKARLKELLKRQAELEADRKAKAEQAAGAAETEAAALREAEEHAAKLREAQKAYDIALRNYNDEKAKLDKMLADLDKSATLLRKFRAKSIDQDGGVYRKSGAARIAPSLLALAAACAKGWTMAD